jgi:opacity protein-like surface antigen
MKIMLAIALTAIVNAAHAFEADADIEVIRWYSSTYGPTVWFEFVADTSDDVPNDIGVILAQCVAFDVHGELVASTEVGLSSSTGFFPQLSDDIDLIEEILCRRIKSPY